MSIPEAYRVPGRLYWKTRLVWATRGVWEALGRMESAALREEIEAQAIEAPIYVTALARSGTTIVTELLHAHPDVTAHHYADFPMVDTPFWRNWLRQRTRVGGAPEPVERAHKDRIMVTEDSPEAVEEAIWTRFFADRHDPDIDQRLGPDDRNAAFDAYYRDHVRKLLMVRGSGRYLAKGNYNVSRLRYLLSLFPDARFVVPVRNPLNHIASLAKQHAFFSEGQKVNPRMRFQLGASGHYEFGLDRRAIHLGDDERAAQIRAAWDAGDEARGWALFWASVYGHLWQLTQEDPAVGRAVLFVPYEQLCAEPGSWIDRILDHVALPKAPFEAARAEFAGRLSPPGYYRPAFDESERAVIAEITAPVARHFGYEGQADVENGNDE